MKKWKEHESAGRARVSDRRWCSAPASRQQPARDVRMVAVEGEGAKYWPLWRGPSGQGLVTGTLSGYLVGDRERAWKTPVPGRGNSSPIVWGDRIFLTTAYDGGRRVSLLAFRRSDGTQLWETFAPDGRSGPGALQERPRVGDAGDRRQARLRVVRQPRACRVRLQRQARLASGPRRRSTTITAPPARRCSTRTASSSIRIIRRRLVHRRVRHAHRQAAVAHAAHGRRSDGARRSPFASALTTRSSSTASSACTAYDPDTGRELWRCGGNSYEVIPTPVVGHGMVFCSSGRAGPTLAIRPGGKGDVTRTHLAWTSPKGSPFVPSPILYGDQLYMVNDMASIVTVVRGDDREGAVAGAARRRAARRIFGVAGRRRRQGVLHQRRGRDVRAARRPDVRAAARQPNRRDDARLAGAGRRPLVHQNRSQPVCDREIGVRPNFTLVERLILPLPRQSSRSDPYFPPHHRSE